MLWQYGSVGVYVGVVLFAGAVVMLVWWCYAVVAMWCLKVAVL
jgi:hypothetical protein